MTGRPHHPLDADEQALATELPRLHGRDQPGPALDAHILAAARSAVATRPAPASTRPSLRQRHWVLPASVAATVAIAAGLAWQLRLPAIMDTARMPAAATAPAASTESTMRVRMIERPVVTPPPPPPPAMVAAPARRSMSSPRIAPAPSAEPAREPFEHFHDEATGVFAAEPANAPPASPPPAVALPAPAPSAVAPAFQPKAAIRESAHDHRNEAERAADTSALDAMTSDTSGEPQVDDTPADDVPPATMHSPQARDAWLTRIRELLRAGEVDAAKASLAEFKHRHPDAPLPPELQQLEP